MLSGLSESISSTERSGLSALCCRPSSRTTTFTSGFSFAILVRFPGCDLHTQRPSVSGCNDFNNEGSSPTSLQSLSSKTHLKPFVFLPYPRLNRATWCAPPIFSDTIERKAEAWGVFPVPPTWMLPMTSVGIAPVRLFRTPESYKK